MLCLVALIIFSILGIFSLTHRQLAKDALGCVFKSITLQPCDVDFDSKIKGRVVGKLINRSPILAKNVNRHWKLISWFLTILFFISLFFSIKFVYNLITPHSTCTVETSIMNSCGCFINNKE